MNAVLNEIKKIMRIAGPIVTAQICIILMEVTDGVMSGILGPLELGALGTAGSFIYIVLLSIFGVQMVVSSVVARLNGAKDIASIGMFVQAMIVIGMVMGVPLMLYLNQAGTILEAVNVAPELIPLAEAYIYARQWGVPAIILFSGVRYFFEGIGKTGPIMTVLIVATLCNIPLNFFLMKTFGIGGIGYATAIVEWIMALGIVAITFSAKYRAYAVLSKLYRPTKAQYVSLLRLGLPSGVMRFVEVGVFALSGLILSTISAEQVAAHQIVLNIAALVFMFYLGTSAAMTSRIGYLIGNGASKAQQVFSIKVSLVGIVCVSSVLAFSIWIFMDKIPLLYSSDSSVIALCRVAFLWVIFLQVFDAVQAVIAGILTGYKDTFAPMIYTTIAHWGFGFVPGYMLAIIYGWGITGVWVGLCSGILVTMVCHVVRLRMILLR